MKDSYPELSLSSDYMDGAHPLVLEALMNSNLERTPGYGGDSYTAEAAQLIREAVKNPEADVFLLCGGTQTNATVLGALLAPYQGVLAPESAHIALHEAGAIEHGGHKIIALPASDGKLSAASVKEALEAYRGDETREHTVMPGAIYISQPTELGTLYNLAELNELRRLCDHYHIALYVDGARLAYALACPENNVSLPALASLADAFYIGGTKCGALFGEAVVLKRKNLIPHFFSIIKQNGALLAKGRLLGVQFKALFTDHLYEKIGQNAICQAERLREGIRQKGYSLKVQAPTNQVFIQIPESLYRKFSSAGIGGFWSYDGNDLFTLRFVTSWSTREDEIDRALALL